MCGKKLQSVNMNTTRRAAQFDHAPWEVKRKNVQYWGTHLHVTLNSRRAHHPPNTHQCRNHVLWGVLLWFNVIHFWLPLFSLKASCLTSDPSVCVKGRKVWPLCWWEKAAQWVGWKLGHQADVGGECASFFFNLKIKIFSQFDSSSFNSRVPTTAPLKAKAKYVKCCNVPESFQLMLLFT